MSGTFKLCPVCRKERRTTGGGKLKKHRRQTGIVNGVAKMEACPGGGGYPIAPVIRSR